MLLLMRQRWRASINRFAEAMTLFAAAIAGLFPIMHLGRPQYFYWLLPYPNTMAVWPQWRSALIWDFWAIASYILFSIIFWYVGLVPDLATMRDRANSRALRLVYGALAFGWRGSARHWRLYEQYQITMACLAVPLVVSLHSVVGLDFAASLMPGWEETIFPPYFVVGAMYSGFAMVVLLTALLRWGFRLCLQALITIEHFDVMAKVMLAVSIIMGLSYATEWFAALVSRRASRPLAGQFRVHRGVRAAVLVHAFVQRRHPASVLGRARATERHRSCHHFHPDQYRDVARAYPDRVEHALARLYAEHVAPFRPDPLGLVAVIWLARLLRAALLNPGAAASDGVDVRGASAHISGGAVVNNVLLAEFSSAERLRETARRAHHAGYRPIDAFTPYPIEGLADELEPQPSYIRIAMFLGGVGAAASLMHSNGIAPSSIIQSIAVAGRCIPGRPS